MGITSLLALPVWSTKSNTYHKQIKSDNIKYQMKSNTWKIMIRTLEIHWNILKYILVKTQSQSFTCQQRCLKLFAYQFAHMNCVLSLYCVSLSEKWTATRLTPQKDIAWYVPCVRLAAKKWSALWISYIGVYVLNIRKLYSKHKPRKMNKKESITSQSPALFAPQQQTE